jgi:spore coat polysaccharide biosynthesis predicted glycosyltransferase SpsG
VIGPVLLRCAGSARVGLGHVMRSLAVAHAIRARGGRPTFVMADDPVASEIPRARGFAVRSVGGEGAAVEARTLAGEAPGAWVVLDGYALGDRVRPLARAGLRVCLIDDTPAGMPEGPAARLWIRPGLALQGPAGGALCGPRWAPIRPEIRRARLLLDGASRAGRPPRLAILSGGSDAGRVLARALGALIEAAPALPPFEVVAIVGPAADEPRLPAPPFPLELARAPVDLAARLAACTLAVTAAGTTVLELLCLGVPPLMLTVVDNQEGVAARVAAAGAGIDLGRPEDLNGSALGAAIGRALEERPRMARRGRALVDGGGARRIAAAMLSVPRARA